MSERRTVFGQKLLKERTQRGLSLEEVAAAIKVRPTLLQALEEGRFDDLPPALFVEGYIKAYARHLGLPPGPLAAEFKSIVRFSQAAPEAVQPQAPMPPLEEGRSWGPWLAGLLFLVAVSVAAYFLVGYLKRSGQEVQAPGARHTAKEAAAPRAPESGDAAAKQVPPQGQEAAVAPPALEPAPSSDVPVQEPATEALAGQPVPVPAETPPPALTEGVLPEGDLVLAASRSCWCEVWVDGQRKIYRLLVAGEKTALKGHQFKVSLGNAGAVELFYHGAAIPLPRQEGAVVKDLMVPSGTGGTTP